MISQELTFLVMHIGYNHGLHNYVQYSNHKSSWKRESLVQIGMSQYILLATHRTPYDVKRWYDSQNIHHPPSPGGKWKSRTRADTDSDSDSDTSTAKSGKGRHRLECQDMQACPLYFG